jgi:hypothetical protein
VGGLLIDSGGGMHTFSVAKHDVCVVFQILKKCWKLWSLKWSCEIVCRREGLRKTNEEIPDTKGLCCSLLLHYLFYQLLASFLVVLCLPSARHSSGVNPYHETRVYGLKFFFESYLTNSQKIWVGEEEY